MRKSKNNYFKYTVRGFLIGVILTSFIWFLVSNGIVKAEQTVTEPVVVAGPTVVETGVNQNDLEILAHLIGGEAGADWCDDTMLYYVGSVVLNRVKSPDFPNTIEDVVFQKGQYACTWDGNYYREPSERCYRIAEQLLKHGSVLPGEVVFQAQFEQGSGVCEKVQNMYFCYK